MTLGLAPRQADLFSSTAAYCEGRVAPDSIYGILHRECYRLFPDEMFADLFEDIGPAVGAAAHRGGGDGAAAAGGAARIGRRWTGSRSTPAGSTRPAGWTSTTRASCTRCWWTCARGWPARSGRSGSSRCLDVAKKAGLVGRRRVLDSTPLYDAVATQDTVTMVRLAIRGLLRSRGSWPASCGRAQARRRLRRGGQAGVRLGRRGRARGAGRRARARRAARCSRVLEGRKLGAGVTEAAALLATVVGQDLDRRSRAVPDRATRRAGPGDLHGRSRGAARAQDSGARLRWLQGPHRADPDSEIITATGVTPGNSGDAEAAEDLLADTLPGAGTSDGTQAGAARGTGPGGAGSAGTLPRPGPEPPRQAPARPRSTAMPPTAPANCSNAWKMPASTPASRCSRPPR